MYYTNFYYKFGKIFVRYIEDGKRKSYRDKVSPYLFVSSEEEFASEYTSYRGRPVKRMDFASPNEARQFIQNYRDVENFEIFGMEAAQFPYINDVFSGEIDYDRHEIIVANVDIEVYSDSGVPDVVRADKPITAITVCKNGVYHVFHDGEYSVHRDDIEIISYPCDGEKHLLAEFLVFWERDYPDIFTGWNVEIFDVPYLINRIINVMGEKAAKRLSPWKMFDTIRVLKWGQEVIYPTIVGISVLDYLVLYKKFTYTKQETYKLNYIAHVEVGEKKLDYSEYSNLHELYIHDYQKYIEYNIKDVELVERIEAKKGFISLAIAIAYFAKVNYIDAITSVRLWDVIIHNFLMARNQVVPIKKDTFKTEPYEGAYVKEPKPGMYNWVASFDLNSLYPHLIKQFNISPEKFRGMYNRNMGVDYFLNGNHSFLLPELKEREMSITPNGAMFDVRERGFLGELMTELYARRKAVKNRMNTNEREYQKTKDESLLNQISLGHTTQMAYKIMLNSAYGAIGNPAFRFFEVDMAEAITTAGQYAIRTAENEVNKYANKILKTEGEDYIVAADTDSIYITLDRLVKLRYKDNDSPEINEIVSFLDKACDRKFTPFIRKMYENLAQDTNAFEQAMIMDREVIAEQALWTAKKRYAMKVWDSEGTRFDTPKLKLMGIEAVKSSTPSHVRIKIKEAIEVMFNDGEDATRKFVNDYRDEFRTLSFDDVAFPRRVKNVDKWMNHNGFYIKGTPIHVRAAILHNLQIYENGLNNIDPIRSGDDIKFAYLALPNPIFENVIASAEGTIDYLELQNFIDYDKQFDKAFLEPLNKMLIAARWALEKKITSDNFF